MKKDKIVNAELINHAIQLVAEARNMVSEAIAGTRRENVYYAYGEYGFSQLLGDGNPYDKSLETLIEEDE